MNYNDNHNANYHNHKIINKEELNKFIDNEEYVEIKINNFNDLYYLVEMNNFNINSFKFYIKKEDIVTLTI